MGISGESDRGLQCYWSPTHSRIPHTRTRFGREQQAEELAQAVERKQRLLNYERTAAERTRVIDDQADYYAYETNTWLSSEERAAAEARVLERERQRQEARKRVVFDLAGRRVLAEDDDR